MPAKGNDPRPIVLDGGLLEPRISEEQRRLAVRYDALRTLLGKTGRLFTQSRLIEPAPTLHVLSAEEWEQHDAAGQPSPAHLRFRAPILGAHSVTLWDLPGRVLLSGPFDFPHDVSHTITVPDPGPGASVEVRDQEWHTIKIGVPVRVEDYYAYENPEG